MTGAAPSAGDSGPADDEGLELRRRLERLMRRREVVLQARLRSPRHDGAVGDLAIPGETVESVDHRVEEHELVDIDREITEIERRLAAGYGSDPIAG